MIGKKKRKAGKRAGGPVGRAAISAARREHDTEIKKLALLIAETTTAPPIGFFGKVLRLANRGEKSIPPALIAEGVRLDVDARELYRAFENFDHKKQLSLFARLGLADDILCEKEWDLKRENKQWKKAHPDRAARPGEVWRWTVARQEREDTARNEAVLRDRASEIAFRDRDLIPLSPGDKGFRDAFKMWERKDWSARERWPTVNRVKDMLAMSRKQIMAAAKSGRWPKQNIYLGAACQSKKGGRPPEKLSPRGVAQVLLAFERLHPHLSAEAKQLASYLSAITVK